jgi:hypothetical protein
MSNKYQKTLRLSPLLSKLDEMLGYVNSDLWKFSGEAHTKPWGNFMCKSLFLALFLVYPLSLSAQNTPEFPTENEISTLMRQANLAMKQYQVTMLDETAKLGKDATAEENEKKALENWQVLVSVMKAKPDNFNSGASFMVVDQLNTAYQTALACEVNSMTNLAAAVLLKNESRQNTARDVSNSCLNAAQLLVIVKVSATNLYTKYLQAQKVLYEKSFNAAVSCAEALKKIKVNKP